MDPDMMALFRELADRSPSEREAYYDQRKVPASLRAEVESLLRFDTTSGDALKEYVAAAAEHALLQSEKLGQAERIRAGVPLAFGATGRFVLQRQLGAGAFGTVYQVWDREQQVTVALKVLHE